MLSPSKQLLNLSPSLQAAVFQLLSQPAYPDYSRSQLSCQRVPPASTLSGERTFSKTRPGHLYPLLEILVSLPSLQDRVQTPQFGIAGSSPVDSSVTSFRCPLRLWQNLAVLCALSTSGDLAALCLCTPLSPPGTLFVYLQPSPFAAASSSGNPVLIPPEQRVGKLDYSRSKGG